MRQIKQLKRRLKYLDFKFIEISEDFIENEIVNYNSLYYNGAIFYKGDEVLGVSIFYLPIKLKLEVKGIRFLSLADGIDKLELDVSQVEVLVLRGIERVNRRILERFSNLKKLYFIDVEVNVRSLFNLKSLNSLVIENCKVFEFVQIEKMEIKELVLKDLDIEEHKFKFLPINLERLDIERCGLSSLHSLPNFSNLHILRVPSNMLISLDGIERFRSLEFLNIANNPIRSLAPVKYLKGLKLLIAYNCEIDDLSPISELTQLFYLRLGNNRIKNINPLSKLSNLRVICLKSNSVKLPILPNAIQKIAYLSANQNMFLIRVDKPLIFYDVSHKFYGVSSSEMRHLTVSKNRFTIYDEKVIGFSFERTSKQLADLVNKRFNKVKYLNAVVSQGFIDVLSLSSLRYVHLHFDELSISLKRFVDNNTEIRFLAISTKVNIDLTPLKRLKSLRTLIIDCEFPVDLTPLKEVRSLKILGIRNLSVYKKEQISFLPQIVSGLITSSGSFYGSEQIEKAISKFARDFMHYEIVLKKFEDRFNITRFNRLKYIYIDCNFCVSDYDSWEGYVQEVHIKQDKLIAITLNHLKLKRIPEELFELRDIEYLGLCDNLFDSNEVLKLNVFYKLKELNFKCNRVERVDGLVLANLERLNLFDNPIKSLKGLEKLSKLKKFVCSNVRVNDLDYIPEGIEVLELYFRDGEVLDVGKLLRFNRLKEIDLYVKKALDIGLLAHLKQLKKVFIDTSEIESLDFLLELPDLEELAINANVKNYQALLKIKRLSFAYIDFSIDYFTYQVLKRKVEDLYVKEDKIIYRSKINRRLLKYFNLTIEEYLELDLCEPIKLIANFSHLSRLKSFIRFMEDNCIRGDYEQLLDFERLRERFSDLHLLYIEAMSYLDDDCIYELMDRLMDKGLWSRRGVQPFQCYCCKHFDLRTLSCKAFPEGIPFEVLAGFKPHRKLLKGQVGSYKFTKKSREEILKMYSKYSRLKFY